MSADSPAAFGARARRTAKPQQAARARSCADRRRLQSGASAALSPAPRRTKPAVLRDAYLPQVTSNGEVEGPHTGPRLEPRAHNFSQRPRRHHRASRTPPTIVRRHGCGALTSPQSTVSTPDSNPHISGRVHSTRHRYGEPSPVGLRQGSRAKTRETRRRSVLLRECAYTQARTPYPHDANSAQAMS